jgi:Fic family protein
VQSVPVSAPTSQTPIAEQTQPSAQQDQVGFIHSLLIKAQAKIQSNKQKKLNEIIQLAQKKQIIKNEDVQKLLRISSATATRYLVKLVQQGHLIRIGSLRDAKYQFVN